MYFFLQESDRIENKKSEVNTRWSVGLNIKFTAYNNWALPSTASLPTHCGTTELRDRAENIFRYQTEPIPTNIVRRAIEQIHKSDATPSINYYRRRGISSIGVGENRKNPREREGGGCFPNPTIKV